MLELSKRYGPVVRVAPNELAYTDANAWREILGHNPKGEEVGKWTPFYRPVDNMPMDIISADRDMHGKLRRQLAHGFSDRSMREQEPIIRSYVDKLMSQLRERCRSGEALDMAGWYNYTTFDVGFMGRHQALRLDYELLTKTLINTGYWRLGFRRALWLLGSGVLAQVGCEAV